VFCQSPRKPLVGVACGYGDIAGRNNKERAAGNIGQRISFISPADAQRAAAMQKKRHVSAESGSNFSQVGGFDAFSRQPEQPNQRRGGVARSATESTSDRDTFSENGPDALTQPKFAAQLIERPMDEIVTARDAGQGRIAGNAQIDSPCAVRFELKRIVQGNRLKDGAQLVIAVRAAPENVEAQIDLCVCWNTHGFHS
jgi:hypothetical protein